MSMNKCIGCGNKAKKGCEQKRCRACCRSHGFDCKTHVHSTWVSAAQRREKEQLISTSSISPNPSTTPTPSPSPSPSSQQNQSNNNNAKRQREDLASPLASTHNSTSVTGRFPTEVSCVAVFQCVKVRTLDKNEDEEYYAYRASINIGGHVFKGLLHDHGPQPYDTDACESKGGAQPQPQQQQHPLDHTCMPETQYFTPPRP